MGKIFLLFPGLFALGGCASTQPVATGPDAGPNQGEFSEAMPVFQLEALDRKPLAIRLVDPEYPAELKRKGIGGIVTVELVVARDGRVHAATVTDSPHPALAKAAQAAVMQWVFTPGVKDGRAVNSRVRVTLTFEAEKPRKPDKVPQPIRPRTLAANF